MRYLGKITDPKDLVNKEYVDDINTSIQAELDTKANTTSVEAALDTKAPVIVNSASGTIASFTDGADNMPIKSATVQITPVQDLHGYDHPWPAGGGKNLFNKDAEQDTSHASATISGETITITGNYYVMFDCDIPAGTYFVSCESTTSQRPQFAFLYEDSTATSATNINSSITLTQKAVKVTLYVSTGAVATGEYVKVQIEAGSTKTAFAPYSNICPITGWTGANVTRTGINVWDEEWEVGRLSTSDGTPVASANTIRSANFCAIKPSTTYYATCGKTDGGSDNRYYLAVYFYDASQTFISSVWTNNLTFTTPSNAFYFKIATNGSTVIYGATYNHDISINYPSSDTSYHAYSGTTIPVSWSDSAGTIYKGRLEYSGNGVWTPTATHGCVEDMGTLSWGYAESTNSFYSTSLTSLAYAETDCQCSIFKGYAVVGADSLIKNLADNSVVFKRQDIRAHCKYSAADGDVPTFVTAITGQKLVYQLATPIVGTPITTAELVTLLGNNNIWADCGDTSVEYPADTKMYIDKQVANLMAVISSL